MYKLCKIFVLCVLGFSNAGHALEVRTNNVHVLSIGKKTLDGKLWAMYYIVLDDPVFSLAVQDVPQGILNSGMVRICNPQ